MPYLPIAVQAAGYQRKDKPVDIDLDLNSFSGNLRLVEVHAQADPTVVDEAVPFQLDTEGDSKTSNLVFILNGVTDPTATRHFQLHLDASQPANVSPLVGLTDQADYQGQDSFKITTPGATYYYHKYGAGFASMIDPDGHDWLSYRPGGGSDGKFRGIPNLVYPEGYFHPGGTELTSRIISQGPLKLKLYSETKDQKWACTWDIYPTYARLMVLRAPKPYWFLYEGTPGGKLNEANDYVVRSSGLKTPASERWDGSIPDPRWLYFGAGNVNRALYLVHHETDGEFDSYWPMETNMTVFGFGRLKLESTLEKTPACFTVGFADTTAADHPQAGVVDTIDGVYRPLEITVNELIDGSSESRTNGR